MEEPPVTYLSCDYCAGYSARPRAAVALPTFNDAFALAPRCAVCILWALCAQSPVAWYVTGITSLPWEER